MCGWKDEEVCLLQRPEKLDCFPVVEKGVNSLRPLRRSGVCRQPNLAVGGAGRLQQSGEEEIMIRTLSSVSPSKSRKPEGLRGKC